MKAEDFEKCGICGSDLGIVPYDAPLYCKYCIAEMERLNMSPEKYKEYKELKETLGKK
jgi:threonine dehydrogenase-like Zn-dependent dehydrogenase